MEWNLGPCKLGCTNGLLQESWLGELTADGHKLFWIGALKVYVASADHSQDGLTTLLPTQAKIGETLRWMQRNGIRTAAALCRAFQIDRVRVFLFLSCIHKPSSGNASSYALALPQANWIVPK